MRVYPVRGECARAHVSLRFDGMILCLQEYIKALIDVMTQAEDLESLENLHALCSCMQTIRMSFFNK